MAAVELDLRRPETFGGPDAPSGDDLATCVHCGLCLNYCPTYRITGLETESPRGRIYLMTQWQAGNLPVTNELARHIDLCLGCRTCEAVCPSGVPYGRIIEHGRAELERVRQSSLDPNAVKRWAARVAMAQLLPHPGRLRAVAAAAGTAQRAGLARFLPGGDQLPTVPRPQRSPAEVVPPLGPRRYRVAFLSGCVMPHLYPEANAASVELLRLAGCEVWTPPDQVCCGALFAHNGDLGWARRLRTRNQNAFGMADFDVLVVNSAGCASHLKDFYPNLGTRVRDLSEFLADVGLPEPRREQVLRVTYQDPCHLAHAQRITEQPRRLLRSLPGVEFVEMPHADICCGSAGIYNLLEPGMSRRILAEKMDALLSVAPDVVVTANPGCELQLAAGMRERRLGIPVMHLSQLVAAAYASA